MFGEPKSKENIAHTTRGSFLKLIQKRYVKKSAAILLITLIILTVYLAVKFWFTGTLKVGNYYINGWTPFYNIESYFYFGKYDRDKSFKNLVDAANSIPTPTVKPYFPTYTSSPTPELIKTDKIDYYLSVPTGWNYGTNLWGENVIKKGNPRCNCGYECYGIYDYCTEDEINTYGEISVRTSNFCEGFENTLIALNIECKEFETEDFLKYKEKFFPESNTGFPETEGCGPYTVRGPLSETKVAGLAAVTQYDSESCRYPSDKEFYIFSPEKAGNNLINISVKNYDLYKTEVDKTLNTFRENKVIY